LNDDRQAFLDGCKKLDIEITSEQMERIDQYALLLEKWNQKFNLVGPDTIKHIYSRHILDCAQVVPFINDTDIVLDIGAGSGLPSLIIAILTGAEVHACERIGKKVQFMNEVKRKTKLGDRFLTLQEDVFNLHKKETRYSVVTSRAFSQLDIILKAGRSLLTEDGKFVLLKGVNYQDEILAANLKLDVTVDEKDSITFTGGKILVLK